jgi:hypothetical protein
LRLEEMAGGAGDRVEDGGVKDKGAAARDGRDAMRSEGVQGGKGVTPDIAVGGSAKVEGKGSGKLATRRFGGLLRRKEH